MNRLTLEQVIELADDVLANCSAVEEVVLDIITKHPVSKREEQLANCVSRLYELIHPYAANCPHQTWVEKWVTEYDEWRRLL